MRLPRPGWRALAVLLATAGGAHLVRPAPFASIVPGVLGDPLPWVYASGVAEIACAAGLVAPRTRRGAALATALLFVAVFPANVQMAADAVRSPRAGTAYQAVSLLRLPVQVPLVLWALDVSGRVGRSRRPGAGS